MKEIEIYKLTQNKRYCSRNYAHTDYIEYITSTAIENLDRCYIARLYRNNDIILDEVMDYEDYSNSVEANCEGTPEEDYPIEGIRVIVIN